MPRDPERPVLNPQSLDKLFPHLPQAIATLQTETDRHDPRGQYLHSIGVYDNAVLALSLTAHLVQRVINPGYDELMGMPETPDDADKIKQVRTLFEHLTTEQIQGIWLVLNRAMFLSMLNDPQFDASKIDPVYDDASSRSMRLWYYAEELKNENQLTGFDDPWALVDAASRYDQIFSDEFKGIIDYTNTSDLKILIRLRSRLDPDSGQLAALSRVFDRVYQLESSDPTVEVPLKTGHMVDALSALVAIEKAVVASPALDKDRLDRIKRLYNVDLRRYPRTASWPDLITAAGALTAAVNRDSYLPSASLALDPDLPGQIVEKYPDLTTGDWNIIRTLLRLYGDDLITRAAGTVAQNSHPDLDDLEQLFFYPPTLLAANIVHQGTHKPLIDQNSFAYFPYRDVDD